MDTNQKGAGRPAAITPKVVSKLVEAFKIDATVEEACFYAGISKATYYRESERSGQFRDEIARAQSYPFMLVKAAVMKAVQRGNGALAFKWLERRQKSIYGESALDTSNAIELHQIPTGRIIPLAKTVKEAKAMAEAAIRAKRNGRCR
jgi:hypothetical protein